MISACVVGEVVERSPRRRLQHHDRRLLGPHAVEDLVAVAAVDDLETLGARGFAQRGGGVGRVDRHEHGPRQLGQCRHARRRVHHGRCIVVVDGPQRDRRSLGGREDLARVPLLAGPRQRGHDEVVDVVVGARRVVVEQREPAHVRRLRDVDRVLDRAVTPPDLLGVLGGEVLGVVDHEVGAAEERDVLRLVAGLLLEALRSGRAVDGGLVVGGVHERGAVGLDAVPERQRGVVQVPGGDRDVVDLELALDEVVVLDRGAEVEELDREVRVLHLARERLVDRRVEPPGPVHVPHVAGHEQRREERQALDVVPVRVADEEVPVDPATGPHELLAQLVDAGPAVEHEQRAGVGAHRHARRVAAVADRRRARLGDRAPSSPERDLHSDSPGHSSSDAALLSSSLHSAVAVDPLDLIASARYGERGVPYAEWAELRRRAAAVHGARGLRVVLADHPPRRHHRRLERPETFCNGEGIVVLNDRQRRWRRRARPDPADEDDHRDGPAGAPRLPQGRERLLHAAEHRAPRRHRDRTSAQQVDKLGREGECDFVERIAQRHPLRVLATLLGVERDEEERCSAHQGALRLRRSRPPAQGRGPRRRRPPRSASSSSTCSTRIIQDRRANPRDDLASMLANATMDDGEPMRPDRDLGYFLIVFTAGHDTTRNALAGGLEALLENPDQLAAPLRRSLTAATRSRRSCAGRRPSTT